MGTWKIDESAFLPLEGKKNSEIDRSPKEYQGVTGVPAAVESVFAKPSKLI
ncbi:MAG: hypothetical protein KQH63_00110 [Desulfobulbaceae bacterium]|nr:hypothetical protein [Desulfobulbaceae bacterium]